MKLLNHIVLISLTLITIKLSSVNATYNNRKLPNGWPGNPDSPENKKSRVSNEDETKYYAHHVGAAYCVDSILTDWSCLHCVALGDQVHLVKIFTNPENTLRGLLLLDEVKKSIVLVFRGAVNNDNWIKGFSKHQIDFKFAKNAKVHAGFIANTENLLDSYLPDLTLLIKDSKYANYNIVIAGHSLGGALTILSYPYIDQKLKLDPKKVKLYSYGAPRLGNIELARYYNNLPIEITRFVNENDSVPHLLSNLDNYYHHFTELYFDGRLTHTCKTDKLEDAKCSNSRVLSGLSNDKHSHAWDIDLGSDYCQKKSNE